MSAPVVIFSASIGAGHDGAAAELARRLEDQGQAVVRHDFLDMLPAGLGLRLRSLYASQLHTFPQSWAHVLTVAGRPRVASGAAGLSVRLAASRMLAAIPLDASAVVSTYPLATQVLGRLRSTERLPMPVAAVMTDPWVHPLCVAGGVDVHLAPGRPIAAQVHRLGGPAVAVAPLVRPAFQPVSGPGERAAARHRLGLPVDERLAVVVAGSWGVGDVAATARDITASGVAVPVVVCGRNERLHRRLDRTSDAIVFGWVDTMPDLLRAADVVVHNAGGLSSAEAMASGVPVISYRCLPGHGVANAAALEDADVSPWPQTVAELTVEVKLAITGMARRPPAEAGPDATAIITSLTATGVVPAAAEVIAA
ncbi:glycosyltransferase [Actinoplanes sp. TBRC 11911]|uniref:glycosyltransferase n=1 Tax=Actinoplanes sp. TBRC 11911 TaxID=2729386 RepID=UPI00145D3C21|nr:glycosyltransferase [Actinoplanes sp. TBRC 11911]NMO53724.1 glycosyltransferase [Actinoplanes sp. TBRC 11911]